MVVRRGLQRLLARAGEYDCSAYSWRERVTAIALVLGVAGTVIGLVVSAKLDTPTAATIILIHAAGFGVALAWSRLRR